MYYTSASVKQMSSRKGKPWRGTIQYKDADGIWRQRTKVFGKDVRLKRDAEAACYRWRDEMEQKAQEAMQHCKPKRTVADAIRACLEKQRDLNKLSMGTYQRQLRKLELNIAPYFENKDFYKLTQAEVAEYVRTLSKQMKPNSVRAYFSILAKTYKEAQRAGDIEVNPCQYVALPELNERKINYLDEEGRRKLLVLLGAMDKGDWKFIAASLALYTGMRASEICALQWDDINFAAKTISVNKAASSVKNDRGKVEVEIKRPKTKKGKRVIPLVKQAEEALLAYLETRDPKPSDTLLGSRRANPSNVCASFQSWAKSNGVIGSLGKPITMHGLRHTFATVSVQANVDIKSLASILGHSRADMTLNVYASDDDKAKRLAMGSLSEFLSREEGDDF